MRKLLVNIDREGRKWRKPCWGKLFFFNIYTHFFLILDRVAGHSIIYKSTHTSIHFETFFFFAFHFMKNLHTRTGKSLSLAIKTQIKMYIYDKSISIYVYVYWMLYYMTYNFSFWGGSGAIIFSFILFLLKDELNDMNVKTERSIKFEMRLELCDKILSFWFRISCQ